MFKHVAAIAGTAMAAAAIGGSALAMASTHHAVSGTEHFQLMTTSVTGHELPVIAYGAFTAGGVDHEISRTVDTVVFANGSFKLTHQGGGSPHLNPTTCLFTVNGPATYTLSDGTGAYKGISGSGQAELRIIGVTGRDSQGKCSLKVQPQGFQQLITASGPVSLP